MGRIHLYVLKLKLYLVTLFKKTYWKKVRNGHYKVSTVQVEQKSSEIYDKTKFLYVLLHNFIPLRKGSKGASSCIKSKNINAR